VSLWDEIQSWLAGQGDPEAQGAAQASTAMQPAVEDWMRNVGTGKYVSDYFNNLSQGYDPNRSFAQNAQDPTLMQHAMDLALGFSGGGLATKAKGPAASDLPAPYLSKGADAPLFDYSLPPPDVPQTGLTRAPPPPKGIPDYVQRVADPANLARVKDLTAQGLQRMGEVAPGQPRYWYNPSPILDAFGNDLGSAEQAQRNLKIYADMMGNTTNLARVPQNQRMASWYYQKYMTDPETMPTEVPPEGSGYGHVAQKQHLQNVQDWWPTQSIDPAGNPKPASFSENNMGNFRPYTWDTRNGTIWDLRNTKGAIITAPDKAHYGFLEGTGQGLASDMGISPARQQEASWVTMEPPGPLQTFAEGLEQKIRDTAAKFNMDPREVRKYFAQGKQLLWGLPAGLLGSQLVPSDERTR
jgi:hypothetical protein